MTGTNDFYRHFRSLHHLPLQKKGAYILDRLKRKLADVGLAGKKVVVSMGIPIYLSLGWRLPIWFRSPYILKFYQAARRTYAPETYPGNVVVLSATGDSFDLEGWQKLIAGKLTIHEVPGDHISVLCEPNVEIFAKQLKGCLKAAQDRG